MHSSEKYKNTLNKCGILIFVDLSWSIKTMPSSLMEIGLKFSPDSHEYPIPVPL